MSPTLADNSGRNSQYQKHRSSSDFSPPSRLPAGADAAGPCDLFLYPPIVGEGAA